MGAGDQVTLEALAVLKVGQSCKKESIHRGLESPTTALLSVPSTSLSHHAQVLLHAAKHPHAAVCGILLGPKENAACIDDAVPLFHHTTMNPLMETAFVLVR